MHSRPSAGIEARRVGLTLRIDPAAPLFTSPARRRYVRVRTTAEGWVQRSRWRPQMTADGQGGQLPLLHRIDLEARTHMKNLGRLSLSLPLLAFAGCASSDLVKQIEWNAVSIVVGLGTAGIGWYIASKVRKLDEAQRERERERTARELRLERRRATRERKREKKRAARERELENERAARERKREKKRAARERELENERAAREEKRGVLRAFDRYRRELMGFTDEVLGIMGGIEGLLAVDPSAIEHPGVRATALRDYSNERDRLATRVSSLIERGRFFFPNVATREAGDDGGDTRRGLLDPVLNRIVAAHYVLKAMECGDPASNRMEWNVQQLLSGAEPASEHIQNAYRHLSAPEWSRLCRGGNGFSLADVIISARRSFVDGLFDIIQPKQWLDDVDTAYGIQLSSREPEAPNLRRNPKVGADIDDS